ncbi:MAG: carbon-nitrogen family hydrolase [Ignavibacteriales bacterium]|nr:carbon-nitrogen family hydrolase [Ignavibacteriales bacterium]
MKIGLVQYNPVWEDKEANKDKLLLMVNQITKNVDLIIFPEMTLTGFTMKSSLFAESIDGESFQFFKTISQKLNSDIIAGVIEIQEEKIFNSLIHISRSGVLINKYSKIHPFSFSGEDKKFAKGDAPRTTIVNDCKIGLSICYDLRFPELYRFYGKEKVHLIINIANWPIPRIEHWRTLLKARAIENQCYVIGVNRVGTDPKNQYNGFSSVFDPMGEEIVSLENEEKVVIAEIELEKVDQVRNKFPFLNDISLI